MEVFHIDIMVRNRIAAISERPIQYLRAKSLSRLLGYIDGYTTGNGECVESKQCLRMREPFHRWLCRAALQIDYEHLPTHQSLSAQASIALRNLDMYSIFSILSLSCEDDVSAYDYYVDTWREWLRQSQVEDRLDIVDNDLSINAPVHKTGVIPILKHMNNHFTQPWDTLSGLRSFIDGYMSAYDEFARIPAHPFPFAAFAIWLRKHVICIPLQFDYSWDRLVLFNSHNSFHAVDMFFRYVRAFCADSGIDY